MVQTKVFNLSQVSWIDASWPAEHGRFDTATGLSMSYKMLAVWREGIGFLISLWEVMMEAIEVIVIEVIDHAVLCSCC